MMIPVDVIGGLITVAFATLFDFSMAHTGPKHTY